MKDLEKLLWEFYQEMYEVSEDDDFPDYQQRVAAQQDLLKEWAERLSHE